MCFNRLRPICFAGECGWGGRSDEHLTGVHAATLARGVFVSGAFSSGDLLLSTTTHTLTHTFTHTQTHKTFTYKRT